MFFTDSSFLLFFLPIALILHRAAVGFGKKKSYPLSARITIFALTLVFYGWREPWWLVPFVVSTSLDFLWAKILVRTQRIWARKAALTACVAQNLALLACFKYRDFINQGFHLLPDMTEAGRSLVLPAGISFYTFESMSYVIDVYRGIIVSPLRASDFFTFSGMFPRFIAGPITRFPEISKQLHEYRGMDVEKGLVIFARGLFMKVLFADQFALLVPYAFTPSAFPSNPLSAWIGVTAYAMQIYFDFAGYSLMSIGIGRALGFEFPQNFDRPYKSTSLGEYWNRWHMTLTHWFRDYLFLPLARGWSRGRKSRLLVIGMIVFMAAGLWHGENWTFVAFGAWHGAFFCLEKAWPARLRIRSAFLKNLAVLLIVWLGFILFRSESFSQALGVLTALFRRPDTAFDFGGLTTHFFSTGACVLGLLYCFFWEGRKITFFESPESAIWIQKLGAAAGLAVSFSVLFSSQKIPFLYFQF